MKSVTRHCLPHPCGHFRLLSPQCAGSSGKGLCWSQVALVSRFWTMPFTLAWAISFGFCFPWLPILGLFYEGIHAVSPSQARP